MEINRMIDHTILKADATKDDVMKIIEEAKKYLDANPNLQALLIYEENGKIKTFYTDKLEIINFDK